MVLTHGIVSVLQNQTHTRGPRFFSTCTCITIVFMDLFNMALTIGISSQRMVFPFVKEYSPMNIAFFPEMYGTEQNAVRIPGAIQVSRFLMLY